MRLFSSKAMKIIVVWNLLSSSIASKVCLIAAIGIDTAENADLLTPRGTVQRWLKKGVHAMNELHQVMNKASRNLLIGLWGRGAGQGSRRARPRDRSGRYHLLFSMRQR